jgi:hypothetical protein
LPDRAIARTIASDIRFTAVAVDRQRVISSRVVRVVIRGPIQIGWKSVHAMVQRLFRSLRSSWDDDARRIESGAQSSIW